MIGIIERIKNNVLLKCSTLNEDIINNYLAEIINKGIYHFAEDIISLINDTSLGFNEQSLRDEAARLIKSPIIKKIKRKLFIDSLALQITNDSYIEDYVQNKISIDKIKKQYIRELNINKGSNQLNMTEDLDLTEIIDKLSLYVSDNIIAKVKENTFLVSAVNRSVSNLKSELEESLKEMIDQTDEKYLKILTSELESEYKLEEKEDKKEIKEKLINSINEYNYFNYENFNNLISTMNININEMSKYIAFDSSHISRIRYGKTKPSDSEDFSKRICNYIFEKYNNKDSIQKLSIILECDATDLKKICNSLYNWLTKQSKSNTQINDFLNKLDSFDLNDYIKAIKFDKLKVPNIPFYRSKTRNYYGIEEMKNGELDFFKATVLSKSKEDIFM